MSSIGTGYDLSASQFSPDGRVFQIDYAGKAIEQSGTVIGLRGKNGVVLAVEKIVRSPLYEEDAGARIYSVDKHIGIALAGLLADGRTIVKTAREEASSYRQQFKRPIPLKVLNERLANFIHAYTLYSAVRPFGVSCILVANDPHNGPEMYMIEPSGTSYGYHGCATGKAKQAAKTEIEKLKLQDMEIEQLITEAGKIIYQVHDELKDKLFKMEMSWVCDLSENVHQLVPSEWYNKAYLAGVESKHDEDSDNEI